MVGDSTLVGRKPEVSAARRSGTILVPLVSGIVSVTIFAEELALPDFAVEPSPGKRAVVTAPGFADTEVHHILYLPPDWTPEKRWPVVVEYTGNYAPNLGSTGLVEDAALGFGLSGGECIWVVLPYVGMDGRCNERTWWGDVDATVAYAKANVPRICEEYSGDPDAVVICGFSRGAIGVNLIGLRDEEIAKLWCGFFTHDHYDGVKEWRGTDWGSPLEKYRREAAARLQRIDKRPVMVSQNRSAGATREYLDDVVSLVNFDFLSVPVKQIFGEFPNEIAVHPHTDRWLLKPSEERDRVRDWFAATIKPDRDTPIRDR